MADKSKYTNTEALGKPDRSDYFGILSEVFTAGRYAVSEFQERNIYDDGPSGVAYLVVDDPAMNGEAGFSSIEGVGISLRVSCGDWQSLHAAEYVAGAMAEVFRFNSIGAHVDSRMD